MAHVDFSAIINDFLTAELGEDVRDSLVAIAEALQAAINTQLTIVTTDLDSTDPNAAISAAKSKQLYNRTPHYVEWYNDPDLNAIKTPSIYNLNIPRTDFSFTPLPSGIANAAATLMYIGDSTAGFQILYSLNGDVYTRRYLGARDEWSVWKGGIDDSLRVSGAAADAAAVRAAIDDVIAGAPTFKGLLSTADDNRKDLNGITGNCIYALSIHEITPVPSGETAPYYNYENLPFGASGVMYLVSYGTTTTGIHLLYGGQGKAFLRRMTNRTWETGWHRIDSTIAITNPGEDPTFDDFNNAPLNKIFQIKRNAHLANSPWGNGMSSGSGSYGGDYRNVCGYPDGTLLTYGNDTYKHQLFIEGQRNGSTHAPTSDTTMFFRTYYSEASPHWGAWRCASSLRSPTSTNIAIRAKFIGRWLDSSKKPTNTMTGTLNGEYMSDYLAPYVITIDDEDVPVPFIPSGETGRANPNYINDHTFFNDFNNAPLNSIYQIDLDCTAAVMKHNPRPEKSSVLITTGFSWSGWQHGKVQLCVGTENYETFAYVRYGYLNNASKEDYIWVPWLEVGDAAEIADLKTRVAALEAQVAALGG